MPSLSLTIPTLLQETERPVSRLIATAGLSFCGRTIFNQTVVAARASSTRTVSPRSTGLPGRLLELPICVSSTHKAYAAALHVTSLERVWRSGPVSGRESDPDGHTC